MSKPEAGEGPKAVVKELSTPPNINKRCDYPPEAYWMPNEIHTPFARRNKYNTSGANIRVGVNQFRVTEFINKDISQFDINIAPEPKGAIVYSKVWNSSAVKKLLGPHNAPWLYDNRKLAWSTNKVQILECKVDLGEDEGRPGRESNIFTFTIKQTGKIRMAALTAYLKKEMAWDNSVLECISFLDHALRQGPSERMKLIKRTFVNEYSQTKRLNSYTEAIKGIYSAIRLNESIYNQGTGVGINVDVSNQTFWVGQPFEQLARNFLSCADRKWENLDYNTLRGVLAPVKIDTKSGGPPTWGMSEAFKALRKLQNVRFEVKHRGNNPVGQKEYKVKRILFGTEYGEQGACAKAVTFDRRMEDGSVKKTSIFDYYLEKYKYRIRYPFLPLVETTRAGLFPMEVCEVHRFNPYPYKLDPNQTSEIIRFAVQRPRERKTEVMQMVDNLAWGKDKYLAHFGIKVDPSMPMVAAKLLPNPVVGYGNKTTDPKMTGRWDLRGMKFVLPNKQPLVSWAFVAVDGSVDQQTLENFAKQFQATYAGHGGRVQKAPLCLVSKMAHPQLVEQAYNHCGKTNQTNPQIIFFILRDKNAMVYDRLKRNAECRFGAVTQMMQAQHVRKAQGQYMSNVCMKVNAKLGGQTSKIVHAGKSAGFFNTPTMMIGVDVSHGAAGGVGERVSMAAMCVSMDKDAAVYNAAVQTNGYAVEILQPANMHSMLGPLAKKWRDKHNVKPKHVFYMRDGVSEGQFAHVMQFEVEEMKNVFRNMYGEVPKITVIIATKRHHIRFFPEKGDKNGNCMPGTLVEREVTHPFHYDFYLCSHVAIQGTARPVHYNIIHDECALDVNDLQSILYRQCYQYCRATTPVSLHPAVYYAHLASARAHHHESQKEGTKHPSVSPYIILKRPGLMAKRDSKRDNTTATSQDLRNSLPPPLLEIAQENTRAGIKEAFKDTMWWV